MDASEQSGHFEGPTLESVRCAFIDEAGVSGTVSDVLIDDVTRSLPASATEEEHALALKLRTESLQRGEFRMLIPQAYATVRTSGNYGCRYATFESGLGFLPIASDADDATKERYLMDALHDLEHVLHQYGLDLEEFDRKAGGALITCLAWEKNEHGSDAPHIEDGAYVCTVLCKRSLHADAIHIAEKFPDITLREACKRQLALELQDATEGGVAGDFRVTDVVFEGEPAYYELAVPVNAVWA